MPKIPRYTSYWLSNRLAFTKGVLTHLRETQLFNEHIDEALKELNELIEPDQDGKPAEGERI